MAEDGLNVFVRLLGAREAQTEAKETRDAIAGIGDASEETAAKTKESGGLMSDSFKGILKLAAGYGIYEFFKDGISGALTLNQGLKTVNNTLASMGVRNQAITDKIRENSEYWSTHGGGEAEGSELKGYGQLLQQTRNLTEAQQAQTAANKLAVGSGQDYDQTLQLITGAEAGRTRGLQRYLGIITPVTKHIQNLDEAYHLNINALEQHAAAMKDNGSLWLLQQERNAGLTKAQIANAEAADKQATAQKVITLIMRRYGDAQESTSQKLQDMHHAFQNLQTNLSTALLPTISKLISVGDDMARFLDRNKVVADALGIAVATLATVVIGGELVKAVKSASDTLKISALAAKLFGGSASTAGDEAAEGAVTAEISWQAFAASTLIGLVIPAIMILVTHFGTVKMIAGDVARWIVHAFDTVGRFFEHLGPQLLHWIEYPFVKAWDFISGLPSKISHIFSHLNPFGGGGFLHSIGLSHGGPVYRDMGGPVGTDSVPVWMTPGEGVLSAATMQRIGGASALDNLNAGGGLGGDQNISLSIEPGQTNINLDSRQIAEAITHYILKRAARGPSNLIGGSLATGVGAAGALANG